MPQHLRPCGLRHLLLGMQLGHPCVLGSQGHALVSLRSPGWSAESRGIMGKASSNSLRAACRPPRQFRGVSHIVVFFFFFVLD